MFNLANRSTGSLEGFNGFIGKAIPKRSHFFRFVRGLLKIERKKTQDVSKLASSGGATANNKKSSSKVSLSCEKLSVIAKKFISLTYRLVSKDEIKFFL